MLYHYLKNFVWLIIQNIYQKLIKTEDDSEADYFIYFHYEQNNRFWRKKI